MVKPVLVLYSENNDRLVHVLRNCRLAHHLSFLYIDEMLEGFEQGGWPTPLSRMIPANISALIKDAYIINRVFTLENTQILAYLKRFNHDERWFHIGLDQLLNCGRGRAYDVGIRGVSKCLQPLNTQWHRVGRRSKVATPAFTFAFGFEEPDLTNILNPIQKSIWSMHDWKVERHITTQEKSRHKFYVERPIGIPIIVSFVGEEWELLFPNGSIQCDAHSDAIIELIMICKEVFCSEAGEFLMYLRPTGTLCFQAFSPHLMTSSSSPTFPERVCRWLESSHLQ